ncbi:FKFBP, partial [Symbiodinium sp. KB8]
LIDAGRKIVSYDVRGYLHSRITLFLSNLCITPRSIFITRHGESEFNVAGKIGGDSNLSPLGSKYAERLAAFFSKRYPENEDLMVWTSTLKRTMQTAAGIERDIVTWRNLDEIDAGICDGMTYEEVAEKMPEEYEARKKDKFRYRYPRGESYQDIVYRLEPVILELMRTDKPVIISHQATLRVLYSYLTDLDPPRCPSLLMPLHTVIELVPKAYGCEEIRHVLMK